MVRWVFRTEACYRVVSRKTESANAFTRIAHLITKNRRTKFNKATQADILHKKEVEYTKSRVHRTQRTPRERKARFGCSAHLDAVHERRQNLTVLDRRRHGTRHLRWNDEVPPRPEVQGRHASIRRSR